MARREKRCGAQQRCKFRRVVGREDAGTWLLPRQTKVRIFHNPPLTSYECCPKQRPALVVVCSTQRSAPVCSFNSTKRTMACGRTVNPCEPRSIRGRGATCFLAGCLLVGRAVSYAAASRVRFLLPQPIWLDDDVETEAPPLSRRPGEAAQRG